MNSYQLLISSMTNIVSLNEREQDIVIDFFKFQSVKKKTHLQSTGQVCFYAYFVVYGCFRLYTVDKYGNEHVIHFAPRGWWIGDIPSYLLKIPGKLNIEAIENSEVLALHTDDREKIIAKVPQVERYFRTIAENAFASSQNRLVEIMSLTAEERYKIFITRYPTLVDKITQKQIAYYLGVSPEFLSAIIKKKSIS